MNDSDQLPKDSPTDSAGERLVTKILRALVLELQEMDATLSGDDSVLETVWDEICVQQQAQESAHWEVYEMTVQALIAGAIEELSHDDQTRLWLITHEGEDWSSEVEAEDASPSPCADDIERLLFERLMEVASNYSNSQIVAYRDRPID